MWRFSRFAALLLAIIVPAVTGVAAVEFYTPYVTRAEATMILLKTRLKERNIPAFLSGGRFPDVAVGEWYERYVVLGVQYGMLVPSPVTNAIRPGDPLPRAEFLKMLAVTFDLPPNLPALHRDVDSSAWYAQYAGIVGRFKLFPADADPALLQPGKFMTHEEVARALRILVPQVGALPPIRQVASLQNSRSVTLYDVISTKTAEMAQMKRAGMHVFAVPPPPSYEDPAKLASLRDEVIALVNAQRRAVRMPPLTANAALEISAQTYAQSMAQGNFFGHISPAGQTLQDRVNASDYYRIFYDPSCDCIARFVVAENLARGQRTPRDVVDAWIRSLAHRQAMLTGSFTDAGVGIDAGVWVMHMGGPAN